MVNSTRPIIVVISIVNFNCHEDIISTLQSYRISLKNSLLKFIIVDNFYNEIALAEIKKICDVNDLFLIESENLGYGNANNLAFEYAKKNILFDFFIVSNPDIQVVSIDNIVKYMNTIIIIAPKITTLNGILQNPFLSSRSPIILWLWKIRYLYSSSIFRIVASILTKFTNYFSRLNNITEIYSPHGSLIIISAGAANILENLFDSRIFLFGEEFVLAEMAYKANIPVKYDSTIQFLHKCNVSTGRLESKKQYMFQRESFLLFYRDYFNHLNYKKHYRRNNE